MWYMALNAILILKQRRMTLGNHRRNFVWGSGKKKKIQGTINRGRGRIFSALHHKNEASTGKKRNSELQSYENWYMRGNGLSMEFPTQARWKLSIFNIIFINVGARNTVLGLWIVERAEKIHNIHIWLRQVIKVSWKSLFVFVFVFCVFNLCLIHKPSCSDAILKPDFAHARCTCPLLPRTDSALRASMDSALRASDSISNSLGEN